MTLASQRSHRERNRMLPCSIASCHNRRSHSSRWCSSHAKRNKFYGHPQGRALSSREVRPYRSQGRIFLRDHWDTTPVEEAVRFFNELLSLGSNEQGASDSEKQLYRLALFGLTASEALEIVLGVWLYSAAEPRALPDDKRLTYAMATALFKARTVDNTVTYQRDGKRIRRYFTPPGNARKEVGEILRSRLGLFMSNVNEALKEKVRKRQESVHRLAQPFNTTTPN